MTTSISSSGSPIIDSRFLLNAYCNGFFPMAEGKEGEIRWFAPEFRGIIPLDGLKVSRSLRRTLRNGTFDIRMDTDFEAVIRACADRKDVWISETIVQSYVELHRLGFAHSVESWCGEELAGGLYGVAIGGAFFGESMFSRRTDASKAALAALVEHLNKRDYRLLDTQYQNDHLATLGCIEIPQQEYLHRLDEALRCTCHFA